ncbi:chain length determinant protein EpsF [Duganella sp. LX20W]|uniref:Chain length determinant protein EpsF n=1 Tax=Rugamonas brunnea TaxID=2758569 RepID=A0A7W2ERA1_9BURK|nr:chain length determinant protein EpsF [Rugamonas brunnea]MBA5637131.1 chain length determinant protein EpsF [Rugamonas brunnea]
MNASLFLLILRARMRIILVTFFVTVVATVLVSLFLPKTYTATSTVVMNTKGTDPLTGMTLPGQLLPGYMATQVDIISSKNVALRVVDQLKLAQSPAVLEEFNRATEGKGSVRDWLADLLLRKLDVAPARESSVVDIIFKGADPQFVAAVANAFAEEYQRVSIQLKVDPLKKASSYFDEQMKTLRDNLETAQSRLSKYQQEHGIVSVDNRLDVETNRLNDLSAQLVAAQGQVMEAQSRQRMAHSDGAESPDVASNALIQNLKINLGNAEAKLAEVAQRLDRNHPQYQSAKAEVEKLQRDLNTQLALTSQSVGNNARILQQREAAIREAFTEQRAKLLELNRGRDELNVLSKDVESAQRAYDVTAQRFAQTKIESSSETSDVMILNPAVPPVDASSPKIALNIALSVVLGGLLGVAFAILAEMLDRRVRTDADLASLDLPLLGEIDWKASQRPRKGWLRSSMPSRLRLN